MASIQEIKNAIKIIEKFHKKLLFHCIKLSNSDIRNKSKKINILKKNLQIIL